MLASWGYGDKQSPDILLLCYFDFSFLVRFLLLTCQLPGGAVVVSFTSVSPAAPRSVPDT